MKQLPSHLRAYKRTPSFTETTVPKGLLGNHRTAPGVWAKIHVEQGELLYIVGAEQHLLRPGTFGIIEPEVIHSVAPQGPVQFFVEFYKAE